MRKLGLFIVAIFLALPIALCTSVASAADIPSSASGTYAGAGATAGWACELRFDQVTNGAYTNRRIDASCTVPGGARQGARTTNLACITEATAAPLADVNCTVAPCVTAQTPTLSVTSYAPSTAQCALGQVTVSIAGQASTMCRTQIVLPSSPYPGCGDATAIDQPPPPKPKGRGWACRYLDLWCG